MGMVLGDIHCVDGHCVMGEEVLEIYLLTLRAEALYLNVESRRGEGKR